MSVIAIFRQLRTDCVTNGTLHGKMTCQWNSRHFLALEKGLGLVFPVGLCIFSHFYASTWWTTRSPV